MATAPQVEVEWAFLSDHALIDAQGKISIIGIFDRLFSATYPAIHPVLFLVARWRSAPNTSLVAELRIWSPGKELLATTEQQLQFGPEGEATGIMQLSPVALPAPGSYVFELLSGGASLKHLTLAVERPPQ